MQKILKTEIIEEKPLIKNTADMRTFLIEQMVNVTKGELDPAQVSAIARLAQQVYNFAKLELKAAQVRAQHKSEEIKALEF